MACDQIGDRDIRELATRLVPLLADPDADVAEAALHPTCKPFR